MTNPPGAVKVTAVQLRQLFNQGQYYQRLLDGELRGYMKRDGHPANPIANEPVCTHSQLVVYYESAGGEIARVHQYVRSDGTLGLSGRPDPKRLLVNGVIYWTP